MTPTHAALLRAVNVGGRNMIAMRDLCEVLGRVGLSNPRSLLQSGNVVFGCGRKTGSVLEALLERELQRQLGLETDFFVRDADEWAALVAANPFPREAAHDPAHLRVLFLKDTPAAADVRALEGACKDNEIIRGRGKQLYVVYPKGMGRSRLTMGVIEKRLGTSATTRNWNTVMRIGALLREGPT